MFKITYLNISYWVVFCLHEIDLGCYRISKINDTLAKFQSKWQRGGESGDYYHDNNNVCLSVILSVLNNCKVQDMTSHSSETWFQNQSSVLCKRSKSIQ